MVGQGPFSITSALTWSAAKLPVVARGASLLLLARAYGVKQGGQVHTCMNLMLLLARAWFPLLRAGVH
jgi:hypothetical protein